MKVLLLLMTSILMMVEGRQSGARLHQWDLLDLPSMAKLGGPATLVCRSPSPWFFCVWEGPDRSRACGLVGSGGGIEQPHMCGGSQRLKITGNSSECRLEVSATKLADHGTWTCSLSQDKSLDTVKAHRQLEVGVEGMVELSPEEVVVLGEGDQAELECKVGPAYPRPSLSWSGDREIFGLLDTSGQVFREREGGSHLETTSQRVAYVADLRDNNLNLTCHSRQQSVGGLRFTGERRLTLKVLPLTAMQSKLADRVGILSIIFVTVLVLILAMVIVTMVVLKRRRRPKTERPQPEGVDLLKHVYTIQDKDKNEYLLKASETYEPLNVNFVDLYQTQAASSSDSKGGLSSSFESGNKSSSSRAASSASSLTGPHSSATGDSLATTAEVEPDRTSTSCRSSTYQETHFDSSALREAHYESSPHCPLHPHHTLHIVREGVRREGEGRLLASSSTVHLHTMPPHHQGAATLPHHHPSLFECQHRCFQHHPELQGGE